MGNECAACLRGIPAGIKNMQDIDLSKKIMSIPKQIRKRTPSPNYSEVKIEDLPPPPSPRLRVHQKTSLIMEPVNHTKELQLSEINANDLIEVSIPEPKYPQFEGQLSQKLSRKAKKIDEKLEEFINSSALPSAVILPNGSIFSGNFDENDNKTGEGIEIPSDGSKYAGSFKLNKYNGKGRLIYANGDYYEGNFKDGVPEGKGKFFYLEGLTYEGGFKKGKKHGHGKEEWIDGAVFEGFFEEGLKCGQGKFVWKDGSFYSGEFENDQIQGTGEYLWANGKRYYGEWKNGKMHGKGTFTWPSGRSYEGEYLNDLKHGNGKFMWPDGRAYDGEWVDGEQHGIGFYTFINKKTQKFITRKGKWEKGTRTEWIKE